MLDKVIEMEKYAFKDYTDAAIRLGEKDTRTLELEYRWKGILEVKQELLRMQYRR